MEKVNGADARDLAALGYKQELQRGIGSFSSSPSQQRAYGWRLALMAIGSQ